jgi:Bax protein
MKNPARLAAVVSMIVLCAASARGQEQKEYPIESYKDVLTLFDKLNYTPKAWNAGIREIPRVYLSDIPERWGKTKSKEVTVQDKKRIFFRVMGPLVLHSNELILQEREQMLALVSKSGRSDADNDTLIKLAEKYRVAKDGDLDEKTLDELKRRIDIVPPSLALAQAAEESGWGTSRFAHLGNAVFGQWTWGGDGITPKEQRSGKGNYKIAAYDSPQGSVNAYMLNINTHASYADLRARRADMRAADETISGWKLAETLTRYSERGQAYVDGLHNLMRINHLQPTDTAFLSKGPAYILRPVGADAQ